MLLLRVMMMILHHCFVVNIEWNFVFNIFIIGSWWSSLGRTII